MKGVDKEACARGSAHADGGGMGPLARFRRMIPNALEYALEAKARGQKVAGIFCEYTPRELFYAAGVLPVCMCGGQEEVIAEAEKQLPANLCPLIKSSYGHACLGTNPFMEMADLLVGETTCDGKKKMYEMLGRNRPVHILELPQKPGSEAAFAYWLHEILSLKERLEDLSGTVIDEHALRGAIMQMNTERDLRREIAYLGAERPPLLSGREILLAKSSLSLIPCDLAGYRSVIDWARSRESAWQGRPRILLTGVPSPHGAEKAIALAEDSGAVIVAQETCTGLKPLMENVETQGDLLVNLARKYFHMPCPCMTPNDRRFILLDQLTDDFAPDGVIELIWQACHTYNVESERVRSWAEGRGLPYLRIITDYAPSDHAQLQVRMEAFLELCQSRMEARK